VTAPMVEPSEQPAQSESPRPLAILAVCVAAAALFLIRLTGLPNLVDNEFRLGACVLNAVQGGNWIAPHNSLGTLDKPPMLTWLAALATLAVGRVSLLSLYLPTALATAVLAVLLYTWGTRHAGSYAGLYAAVTYLSSNVVAQQIATARWDGLFALTVVLVALAAFRSWNTGRGWTLFWLAAAVSTLTKGPLGILLGGLGLLAVPWERRSGHPLPLRGSHAPGVTLFLLIVFGWFGLACLRSPHIVDDLIRSELVRHAVMSAPGHRLGKPPSDFVANFAPWSILTILGLWRIWMHPAADDARRRFDRFCFWWFVGGLLLFAISPHNPARLLYPVVPPAAIIAGCEADRLTRGLRPSMRLGGCGRHRAHDLHREVSPLGSSARARAPHARDPPSARRHRTPCRGGFPPHLHPGRSLRDTADVRHDAAHGHDPGRGGLAALGCTGIRRRPRRHTRAPKDGTGSAIALRDRRRDDRIDAVPDAARQPPRSGDERRGGDRTRPAARRARSRPARHHAGRHHRRDPRVGRRTGRRHERAGGTGRRRRSRARERIGARPRMDSRPARVGHVDGRGAVSGRQ